jgi:putative flippase GtrA
MKKIFFNPFLKFLLVGVLNTLFGYLVYSLFVYLIENPYVSVVGATCVAIVFNFKTYGSLVFKSKDNTKIFRFFAIYIGLMAIQSFSIKILAYLGITNAYISGAIVTLPIAALSYFLIRKFVFIKSVQ